MHNLESCKDWFRNIIEYGSFKIETSEKCCRDLLKFAKEHNIFAGQFNLQFHLYDQEKTLPIVDEKEISYFFFNPENKTISNYTAIFIEVVLPIVLLLNNLISSKEYDVLTKHYSEEQKVLLNSLIEKGIIPTKIKGCF